MDELNAKSKSTSAVNPSKETNAGPSQLTAANQDSDSESDTFFSDFNIKRFSSKNDHK